MDWFTVWCKGDVCVGDHIRFEEGVFSGSYRKPSFLGNRTVCGIVEKDSYGDRKQQHTFSIRVTHSEGCQPLAVGSLVLRKGRNVYRNGTSRKPWEDETERGEVLKEKHERGDEAREAREARMEETLYWH